uniref:DNA polymerase V n=1 Tax=Oryza meridionalis TaxID=40149 RepID=A0A0E0CF55_9ORYZ
MAGKKRPPTALAEPEAAAAAEEEEAAAKAAPAAEAPAKKKKLAMERKKQRKEIDKERHRQSAESDAAAAKPKQPAEVAPEAAAAPVAPPPVIPVVSGPGLHMNVFRDLASPEASQREAAAEALVAELRQVQVAHEKGGRKEGESEAEGGDGSSRMEAEKDDGLENCAPSVRYAVRRLIRGISSSREFARQGFALGLAVVLESIHAISVEAIMKLIPNLLEYSASMRGPEAKDNLLGRLFGYGSIVRSGRVSGQWAHEEGSPIVKDFVDEVIKLGSKKRYLTEPAVAVILDLAGKLPEEAIISEILEAPSVQDWFNRAADAGDPDALYLALKLQEKTNAQKEIFGKLLTYPFSPEGFFAEEHLLSIAACFKESTFCLPRIHSLWLVITDMLVREAASQSDIATSSSKKHKKNKKGSSSEDTKKNLHTFCEVIIEGTLLLSSHDRKHLAFNTLLNLLPRLSPSSIQVILSSKVVHGLIDVLSNESSWLHNAGQHFLKELVSLVSDDNDRRVAVITNLQKYTGGRFDCMTKTRTVKDLVAKFRSGQDCLCLVQSLMSLFVDESSVTDEPSDQSQTTDENSEVGSMEDKDLFGQGSADLLKSWIVTTIPCVLKNLKLTSKGNSLTDSEMVKCIEEKFLVQTEVLKFLAVQGLFSASLGYEVTSFELHEKFKWPKPAISTSIRNECIEQLQFLIEDAQKDEALHVSEVKSNDLGFYFMRFINTLCNIPSVSLFRTLSSNDDNAFKKLLDVESLLFYEERKVGPGLDSTKMHAMRYLLIQLLLQVLLHPDEYWEAAIDVTICCKKSFPSIVQNDKSSGQPSNEGAEVFNEDGPGKSNKDGPEEHNDDASEDSNEDGPLEFMDVLVQTFLSVLPHVSGPVFRVVCDEITETGLLDMLRVVKIDLKGSRRQSGSDDDEDDACVDIEDDDETIVEDAEVGDTDSAADGLDEEMDDDSADEVDEGQDDLKESVAHESKDGDGAEVTKDGDDSDDSDGMDDDAMFRIDPYIARIFKERNLPGSETKQSQLMRFKLRVLTLLEIYLQRNTGNNLVLEVYSFLMQAFVKSHSADGSEQFKQRIGGILQKRIFKAKDYPKGDGVELSTLESLLEKALKLASRSRYTTVASVAQNAAFWLLKIINSKSHSKQELASVVEKFQYILTDYFNNKKSRLKLGFVKEAVRRNPWVGEELFGFVLQKIGCTKAEYRRVQTLELVDCILKSWAGDDSSASKVLKKHLSQLCELIQEVLTKIPENKSRRQEVRRFCTRVLQTVTKLNLKDRFQKKLNPETLSLCEAQLGAAFVRFQK